MLNIEKLRSLPGSEKGLSELELKTNSETKVNLSRHSMFNFFMFLAQMHFASEEISSQLHLTTELVFKSKFIQKLNMPAQASAIGQVINSPPLF